jgi:DNA end-binding protein Ku
MWKGAIQFGLVTIPIKLYLATEPKQTIRFNMLHEEDLSRIQMKVWCPVDDREVERSETVKGYEYAPGEYVVVTDEDLEKLPLKTMRSIEIEQFVEREKSEEHLRFVKQAYYIEPDKMGRKAFALLREVLIDKELSAICKVVISNREVLGALDPFAETMMLSTLYWPDEIRSLKELDLPDEEIEVKAAEKKMAAQLIAAMTGEFDPAAYKDEYREALRAVIDAKIEGQEVVAPAAAPEEGKLIDLMAALEASVAAAKTARAGDGEEPVSVAGAKSKRAARAKAKAADEEPEVEEAPRPARKRKTA